MLAARLPGILPPLAPGEALETSMIHSLAGLLDEGGISRARPFRTPHHTASMAAIVGGGRGAKPGEISLAHHGVLFLDELPEFPRTVLETLRQPIETGDVVVARANAHVRYPCRFMLVAAANPCRCGHLADPAAPAPGCRDCGDDYLGRISGPLMDRFDLRVEVPPVAFEDLDLPATGEASAAIAAPRRRAPARCSARASPAMSTVAVNADAEGDLLEAVVAPSAEARRSSSPRSPQRFRPQRPRLSPRAAGGAHHRRPRWLGAGGEAARGRGGGLPARVCWEVMSRRPWSQRPGARRSRAEVVRAPKSVLRGGLARSLGRSRPLVRHAARRSPRRRSQPGGVRHRSARRDLERGALRRQAQPPSVASRPGVVEQDLRARSPGASTGGRADEAARACGEARRVARVRRPARYWSRTSGEARRAGTEGVAAARAAARLPPESVRSIQGLKARTPAGGARPPPAAGASSAKASPPPALSPPSTMRSAGQPSARSAAQAARASSTAAGKGCSGASR